MEYREMPCSIQAEKSIIGSMIMDKSIIPSVMQKITNTDMFNTNHSIIFETIVDLYNKNIEPDIINVSDICGNLEYLANLTSEVVTSANAKHHANIVKGKSIRRQYIDAGKQIIDAGYEGQYENIIELKSAVLAMVDIHIQEVRKASKFKHLYSKFVDNMTSETKLEASFRYGMKWLDSNMDGTHKQEVTIIAARPSVGKTSLAIQIVTALSKQGAKVLFFNLEMSAEQLTNKVIACVTNIGTKKMRNGQLMTDDELSKIADHAAMLNEFELDIIDDMFSIEEIRSKCREMKLKQNIDCVIIDYLQLIDTMKKTSSVNERVSYISRTLKIMSKELDCNMIVLSQLNRDNVRGNRRPCLFDLRDSGSIEQDADNVLMVHDPKNGEYDKVKDLHEDREIIIAKQRNGVRDIYKDYKFYPETQMFYESW